MDVEKTKAQSNMIQPPPFLPSFIHHSQPGLAVCVQELAFGDAGLGYRNTPSSLMMAALLLEIRAEIAGCTVIELGTYELVRPTLTLFGQC